MRNVLFYTALSLSLAIGPVLTGPAQAQQSVRSGDEMFGELRRGDDQLDSGEYLDVYEFQGRAGQPLSVFMTSADFDTYLMIRGPGDFSEDNDDSGDDGTNAALNVRLPADGLYTITATSFAAGEGGRYGLRIGSGGGGRDQTNSSGGQLRPDATASGVLGPGDRALDSGEYADDWTFPIQRGQTYSVSLDAGEFDPYLMVRGPGGLSEDNDDDPGQRGSRNSRVNFTASADGTATVSATSFSSGEQGRYQLTMAEGGRPPASGRGGVSPVYTPTDRPVDGAITVGRPVFGDLSGEDRQLDSGEFIDTYTLRGRRGQQLDLSLSSSAFDPYLAIAGPGGLSEFNDDDPDGGGAFDSRLFVTLPADGDYRITATSYAAGEAGDYRLSVAAADGRAAPGRPRQESYVEDRSGRSDVRGGSIRLGDTVGGTLQSGDETLDTGEFVDTFTFDGRSGQRIAAELTSAAFDAYMILRTPSGEQLDNDDGENGTDSRLDTVLTEDGEYQVMVTSYSAGESGSYRFSVAPSLGTPRQAAVQGGARVFAIMVGISDYGGAANDLPYTDEDAEKLAETLQREGVLNASSIVLTNAEATVGGVRRAFQSVASQAGPDDMFLFFFSGHGSQNDGAVSPQEPDGRTETIVLRDGEITDDEMSALFQGLNTRLSLLVLDSCFSGGFARNVVNRPGVMGLFSSEEDLTSAVADKFEAGGYLSHFLRTGLAGAGDGDGDGAVTAGELATYLRRQFVAEVQGVESSTMEGQRNYQNLVIDRGGVQVDDIVVRLASSGSSYGAH
ncbi:MAG: pre-peptidase C-terminal domain-containing protein [Alphaproteobacteria bacterium]|nr:pre-peptidase C-terminal domain-containing protein [Alphaproteobacteria bacterium]MBU2377796.1 pre-peptidase C-terminal domain-containing protein [Alphaproteobacteria bacterium]